MRPKRNRGLSKVINRSSKLLRAYYAGFVVQPHESGMSPGEIQASLEAWQLNMGTEHIAVFGYRLFKRGRPINENGSNITYDEWVSIHQALNVPMFETIERRRSRSNGRRGGRVRANFGGPIEPTESPRYETRKVYIDIRWLVERGLVESFGLVILPV